MTPQSSDSCPTRAESDTYYTFASVVLIVYACLLVYCVPRYFQVVMDSGVKMFKVSAFTCVLIIVALRVISIAQEITIWHKVVDKSCIRDSDSIQDNFYHWRWMVYGQLCTSMVEIVAFMMIGAGGTYYILLIMIKMKAAYTESDNSYKDGSQKEKIISTYFYFCAAVFFFYMFVFMIKIGIEFGSLVPNSKIGPLEVNVSFWYLLMGWTYFGLIVVVFVIATVFVTRDLDRMRFKVKESMS